MYLYIWHLIFWNIPKFGAFFIGAYIYNEREKLSVGRQISQITENIALFEKKSRNVIYNEP